MKHLDPVPDAAIVGVNVPIGIPLIYERDEKLQPRSSRHLASEADVAAARHAIAMQGEASADGKVPAGQFRLTTCFREEGGQCH